VSCPGPASRPILSSRAQAKRSRRSDLSPLPMSFIGRGRERQRRVRDPTLSVEAAKRPSTHACKAQSAGAWTGCRIHTGAGANLSFLVDREFLDGWRLPGVLGRFGRWRLRLINLGAHDPAPHALGIEAPVSLQRIQQEINQAFTCVLVGESAEAWRTSLCCNPRRVELSIASVPLVPVTSAETLRLSIGVCW
jgi:hypothetical protein